MSHGLSASGLKRGRSCLYWCRTDTPKPEPSSSSTDAKFGTVLHKAYEVTIDADGRIDPTEFADELDESIWSKVDATYNRWYDWWLTAKSGKKWTTELRLAWNVESDTVRVIPKTGGHRDYGVLDENEVPGSLDALSEDENNCITVYDWKHGFSTVDSPNSNHQLAFYGSAVARLYKKESVRVTIVKPSEDAVYVAEPYEIDEFSIIDTRNEIREMIRKIPTAEPNPGPWCDWCSSLSTCPATAENVAQVIDATALVRKHSVSTEITSHQHAAWLLTAVDSVEEYISLLKKNLKEYADKNGGIDLGDGTFYSGSPVRTEKPDLSVDRALSTLYSMGLSEAIDSKVTWAAIRRLGGANAEKEARNRLTQLGAVKSSEYMRYERKPKKEN